MISFKDVCRLCEDVQNTKGLANKKSIFEKTFVNFREDTSFNVQENYEAFYQAFRLIVPKLDHDRKSYNMKEIKIARIIIKMLNLPDGPDKRNLLNYYKMHNQNSTLDFADIVHITLRKYISTKQPTVTVLEVNEFLDSIANRESETGLDDLMLKYAEEYYKSNNNLKKVCEVLWNPSSKSNEFDLHLFEPFQPMLSKRSDGKSFMKDFPEKKLFFIENKFDGMALILQTNLGNHFQVEY
ncbi:hypothetical protein HHI36_023333 [Cryptolaemus montrouzieri]|uniref:DNA ligase ATP-dependent N-terminal domain-containing protein n=1 Tax=Cryptolaemus montrouzieri TaxID=559131 RepID=A0ABD2PG89_9CUCU